MKKKITILALLMVTTGIFSWSHLYYKAKSVELHDKALVMEYKVLDNDVWALEQHQKQQRLSQDASYDELSMVKKEAKGAKQRSAIGYWIALLAGIASTGYFIYLFTVYGYVEIIQKRGYIKIIEWLGMMTRKMKAKVSELLEKKKS